MVAAVRAVGQDCQSDSCRNDEGVESPGRCVPGAALGPGVYLYQEVQYMAEVRPTRTDIPSVRSNGMEVAFNTE